VHTRGTVGFGIEIERMEPSYKLSQNRNKKNHTNIISELVKRSVAMSISSSYERASARDSSENPFCRLS
jgi:transcriptional regulator